MNILKRFVAGLGQQTAPFGFAPDDPEAGYKAGLGYIGDVGANLMANNQGGVDPWANLGASLQQAKSSSTQRNQQQYTAQRLMEEAAAKKAEREQAAAQEAQREEFLKSLPPDVQMKARSIPGFLEDYVKATDPTFQAGPELTADQRNFEYAQQNPEFGSFLQQGQGGTPKLGMTPIPLSDGKGGYTIGQLSEAGGIMLNGKPIDGTEWKPMDPTAVNFAKASGTKEGGAVGGARGDLPGAEKQAEFTTMKIDRLLKDPNLDSVIGWNSYRPDWTATNQMISLRGDIRTLMGSTFLEARQMLKGGGQITDFEGKKAEQAYNAMETAIQSTNVEDFKRALTDFRQAVADGVSKLRANARVGSQGGNAVTTPDGYTIEPVE